MEGREEARQMRSQSWLKERLNTGIEQLEAGQSQSFDNQLIEKIKQNGREKLDSNGWQISPKKNLLCESK